MNDKTTVKSVKIGWGNCCCRCSIHVSLSPAHIGIWMEGACCSYYLVAHRATPDRYATLLIPSLTLTLCYILYFTPLNHSRVGGGPVAYSLGPRTPKSRVLGSIPAQVAVG